MALSLPFSQKNLEKKNWYNFSTWVAIAMFTDFLAPRGTMFIKQSNRCHKTQFNFIVLPVGLCILYSVVRRYGLLQTAENAFDNGRKTTWKKIIFGLFKF